MNSLDKESFLAHNDAELGELKNSYKQTLDELVKKDLHYGLAYAISIIVEYQAKAREPNTSRIRMGQS